MSISRITMRPTSRDLRAGRRAFVKAWEEGLSQSNYKNWPKMNDYYAEKMWPHKRDKV